jgi:hypothetical protein
MTKSIYFWEPNQIGGATRRADSFFQRQRQNYEAVSLARAGRLERCTKVAKGQEDDRNDKSQPNIRMSICRRSNGIFWFISLFSVSGARANAR